VHFEFVKSTAGGEDASSTASVESLLEHALHGEGNNLFHVRSMMQKVKAVETEHRDLVESTNNWIVLGTVISGTMLVATAVFQYLHLTHFLSVKKR
jgi:uncharacterized membrane protein YraQ (UPF0718 family)